MARRPDAQKLSQWRGRFRRFWGSGLSVARFCAAEDVSASSFYYWQKKLRPPTRRGAVGAYGRGVRTGDSGMDACGRQGSGTTGSRAGRGGGTTGPGTGEGGGTAACAGREGGSAVGCGTGEGVSETRRGSTERSGTAACGDGHGRVDRTGEGDGRVGGRGVFQPVTVVPATSGVVMQLPGGTRIEVNASHLDAVRVIVAEMLRADHDRAAGRHASAGNRFACPGRGTASC